MHAVIMFPSCFHRVRVVMSTICGSVQRSNWPFAVVFTDKKLFQSDVGLSYCGKKITGRVLFETYLGSSVSSSSSRFRLETAIVRAGFDMTA